MACALYTVIMSIDGIVHCAVLDPMQGILREPHFPLSKVADKNKDIMIKAGVPCLACPASCMQTTQPNVPILLDRRRYGNPTWHGVTSEKLFRTDG